MTPSRQGKGGRWDGSTLSRYFSRYPLFGALFVDAESPPVPAPLGVRPRSSQYEQGADSL